MQALFEIPRPLLPIEDDVRGFPVHRVFCVGRNYAAHSREMGADEREPPFFFSKPASAVICENGRIPYPPRTRELHHEVELVVALSAGGRELSVARAADTVFGYAVGVDFTRRDLQAEAKKQGRPWDTAKGFEHSAPVSRIRPAGYVDNPGSGPISLSVNGEPRQQGNRADMIWGVNEIIAELSTCFELVPGDLVFTGTPAGVGPVEPGDRLHGEIEGVGSLDLAITR